MNLILVVAVPLALLAGPFFGPAEGRSFAYECEACDLHGGEVHLLVASSHTPLLDLGLVSVAQAAGRTAFGHSDDFTAAISTAADLAGIDAGVGVDELLPNTGLFEGPSAGLSSWLVFAVSGGHVDLGGRSVAATGTVAPDGVVGGIGLVELKLGAAETVAGVAYVPADNLLDARDWLAANPATALVVVAVDHVDGVVNHLAGDAGGWVDVSSR
ncbi:MAG: hypothetical protein GY882_14365 [Actinomycetia bacterium]|nr:hypothetical protein [Actinomycetes bacterium]